MKCGVCRSAYAEDFLPVRDDSLAAGASTDLNSSGCTRCVLQECFLQAKRLHFAQGNTIPSQKYAITASHRKLYGAKPKVR